MYNLKTLFEKSVNQNCEKTAIIYKHEKITYEDLNYEANRIANFLLSIQINKEEPVLVLLERSPRAIASLVGCLKSGACFIPIDISTPIDRIREVIKLSNCRIVISEKAIIEKINRIAWSSSIEHILIVDSDNHGNEKEEQDSLLMSKELWDNLGEKSEGIIDAGGWKSSFTGESLSEAEMNEYSDNILKKLNTYISKKEKVNVLEIGCSSGITLLKIAPNVNSYYGIDLSKKILEKTSKVVEENNLKNVFLECREAMDIDEINQKFDIIIMNSVIQSFHGHNYLTKVLKKSINMLNDHGILFIGDVMDMQKKDDFRKKLIEYKSSNNNLKTKVSLDSELFVSKDFFYDLELDINEIDHVAISEKEYTISNELTEFRYDVAIQIDRNKNGIQADRPKRKKHFYSRHFLLLQSKNNPENIINPSDLAYIIFTSGSTGQPKGVMIEHKGVSNTILSRISFLNVTHNDVGLQFASLGFDTSIYEIFIALISGGVLNIVPESIKKDIQKLQHFLASESITWATLTPSIISLIDIPSIKSVKKLISVGEAANVAKAIEFVKSGGIFYNAYGPAEASICSAIYKLEYVDRLLDGDIIPVGKPTENTNAYIFNDDSVSCITNELGELYIGGMSLARGYISNDELTSLSFVPNPLNLKEILYKTGDLVYMDKDENIVFVGRKTTLQKIHGNRVDLNEIKNIILQEFREINGVEVVFDESSKKILVGFTSHIDEFLDDLSIKSVLKNKVPEYMIPAAIKQVDSFPLNLSKKVDMSQLLILLRSDKRTLKKESNDNDKKDDILSVWNEILGIDFNEENKDFFDAGGNSLDAMKLKLILNQKYGIHYELQDFFDNPTVDFLTSLIETEKFNQVII